MGISPRVQADDGDTTEPSAQAVLLDYAMGELDSGARRHG